MVARVASEGTLGGSRSGGGLLPLPPTVWNSPVFVSGPYEYGVPDAPPMATFAGQGLKS